MQSYSLSEVISLNKGKKQDECNEFDKNAIRYIQIDDLRNDNNLKFTNDKKRVEVNDQDVLIAWDGANAGTIGFNLEGAIGSTIAAIRIKKEFIGKVEPIYLGLFLRSKEKYLRERATGATIPHIQKDSLLNLLLPLAALDKQRMIAQILDKSTALIAKRKAQIAELDKLVQSVFLEMFGDPITNPKKWDVRKLSDIATYFNGLTYKPDQVSESGVVVLRSSNIQNSELCFKDTVKVSCPIKEKLWVKNNDILMCSRNGSANLVGKVALIENIEEKMTFGAFMMIIRSSFYRYLMIYFQTNAFRKQIKTGATTTINQITGAMLDRIELPIPSQELLNHFSKRMTKIHAQKSLLQKSLAELEMQHQALMQKAFNGQLVG